MSAAAVRTRPPAVAGLFYPGDPVTLRRQVEQLLAEAHEPRGDRPPPKAVVVPHAGYPYSGPVAATAYRALAPRRGSVDRVVLLGPAHRVLLDGLAVPSVDAFATPLGPVAIDDAARRRIAAMPHVVVDDVPHADEHSLEVHLPFLQCALGEGWELLPLVVGRAAPGVVADVLAAVWDGPETAVVVSTDLSHYHDHPTARALDERTAAAIVARHPDEIGPADACGAFPLRGLLELCRRAGHGVELLDLRTSGDTAGDRSRVVGYGAFAVA